MVQRIALTLICCLLAVMGCNRSAPAPEGSLEAVGGAPLPANVAQAAPLPPQHSSPGDVVKAFLAALRDGDHAMAAGLLTSVAREETARHDLVVEPPGSPHARFEVGQVEFIDAQQTGAHVKCVWSESEGGANVAYEIIWALRRQTDGWRIAGMATEIVPGQQPVFLNFEDPSDMLEKWQQAEEIAARHQASDAPIRR